MSEEDYIKNLSKYNSFNNDHFDPDNEVSNNEESEFRKSITKSILSDLSQTNRPSRKKSTIKQRGFKSGVEYDIDIKATIKASFNQGIYTVSKEDITLDKLLLCLSKKPKERSAKDISLITSFMEKTDLSYKFKKDCLDVSSLNRMLYFCSVYLTYQFIEQDQLLFRLGDLGDKFYIILKGKVSILKPIAREERLTADEYYKHLYKLRESKEKNLLKLTINTNNEIYPIEMKDINELEDISFRVKYKKSLSIRPSVIELEKIFKTYNKDPQEYNLDFTHLTDLNKKNRQSFSLVMEDRLSIMLSSDKLLNKYKYLENEQEKKVVTIYTIEYFTSLDTGKYFGDYSLDNTQFKGRTATIVAEQDTHLGIVNVDVYREYILFEKQRMNLKEIMYLLDNFFFQNVKKKLFENKYFALFIYDEVNRNTVLFKEGDEVKYIYFIKEGEVELTLHKNILEIHKLTQHFINMKLVGSDNSYELKNEPKNYLAELTKRKLIKLFIYGSKETLGLEEIFLNFPHIYSAKVVSEKAKIYKIEARHLLTLFKEERDCYLDYQIVAKNKIKTLMNRFINVKNTYLSIFDKNSSARRENDNIKAKRMIERNNCTNANSFFQTEIRELSHHLMHQLSKGDNDIKNEISQNENHRSDINFNFNRTLDNCNNIPSLLKSENGNSKQSILITENKKTDQSLDNNISENNMLKFASIERIELPKIKKKTFEDFQIKKLKKELTVLRSLTKTSQNMNNLNQTNQLNDNAYINDSVYLITDTNNQMTSTDELQNINTMPTDYILTDVAMIHYEEDEMMNKGASRNALKSRKFFHNFISKGSISCRIIKNDMMRLMNMSKDTDKNCLDVEGCKTYLNKLPCNIEKSKIIKKKKILSEDPIKVLHNIRLKKQNKRLVHLKD